MTAVARTMFARPVAGWSNAGYTKTLNGAGDADQLTGRSLQFSPYAWAGSVCQAIEAGGYGADAGYCFPGVGIDPDTAIISATLDFDVTAINTASTLACDLEQPLATSRPFDDGAAASPVTMTTISWTITGISGSVGTHSLDVSAQVQAAIDHADWTWGDYLNFRLQAETTNGNLVLGGWNSGAGTPPTLTIVAGVPAVTFDTDSSHLYMAAPPWSGTFDRYTLSFWAAATSDDDQDVIGANSTGAQEGFSHGFTGGNINVAAVRRADITPVLWAAPTTSEVAAPLAGGLHHWMFQYNNTLSASNRFKVWLDGTLEVSEDAFNTGDPQLATYTMIGGHYESAPDGTHRSDLTGAVAAIWADNTASAAVTDFITADGAPKYLGANGELPGSDGQPALYFDGDAAGFATNRGTAGAFTKYGTISDA